MVGTQFSRGLGAWLGQLCGDALGSQVEFETAQVLARAYPQGLRTMGMGAAWHTIPGQVTDDSEMALELAYSLIETDGHYDVEAAARHYVRWFQSGPFDAGTTVSQALGGLGEVAAADGAARQASWERQANGALRRQSPLGISGARAGVDVALQAAYRDTVLTHPHPVCVAASQIYVGAIACAVSRGPDPQAVYGEALRLAECVAAPDAVRDALREANAFAPPLSPHQGHVILAFHNAFYQLLHCDGVEDAIVASVMLGGDTDTNAAIAGSLAGAVFGEACIPAAWRAAIDVCHPDAASPRPRPQRYWPESYQCVVQKLLHAGRHT